MMAVPHKILHDMMSTRSDKMVDHQSSQYLLDMYTSGSTKTYKKA